MASPSSSRALSDNAVVAVSATCPNAANQANTNTIDLGLTTPFAVTEKFHVKIANTASANGANSKNFVIGILHSDVDTTANYTQLVPVARILVDNATSTPGELPAGCTIINLPPGTKRYIRGFCKGEANGGNASDATFTVSILF